MVSSNPVRSVCTAIVFCTRENHIRQAHRGLFSRIALYIGSKEGRAPMVIARLLLLYIHVVAFAVAVGCVLREDARLVSRMPLDVDSLRATARIVASALAVLWISGFGIILVDGSGGLSAIASNPKLLAKIVVVCALTLNGVALHAFAFPSLQKPPAIIGASAHVAAALGATSAVSWAFATFLGISRGIFKLHSFEDLIVAYCLTLAAAVCAASLLVAPILRRKMQRRAATNFALSGQQDLPAQ